MIYTFRTSMLLDVPLERAFAFFSDADNLVRISPPASGLRILTPGPITLGAGAEFELGMRLFVVPIRWRSLIARWDPPREFVDVQVHGPFKSWTHTHRFSAGPGGTTIEDDVRYEMPLGLLGRLVEPLVRRQLASVFRYRQDVTRQALSTNTSL